MWSQGLRDSPDLFSGSHPKAALVKKKLTEQRVRELWPFVWEESPDDSLMPGVVAGSLQKEQSVGPRPSLLAQRVDADVDSEFLRRALCYMPADLTIPAWRSPWEKPMAETE